MFPVIKFDPEDRAAYCQKTWGVTPDRDWLRIKYWTDDLRNICKTFNKSVSFIHCFLFCLKKMKFIKNHKPNFKNNIFKRRLGSMGPGWRTFGY